MIKYFNDLLHEVGIDSEQVRLIRHQTKAGLGAQSLHDFWLRDREGFEQYQSMQNAGSKLFRSGKVWAAFTSPSKEKSLFVGLYDVNFSETRKENKPCVYSGGLVNNGKPVDIFMTKLRSELSDQIGKLEIQWDPKSIRRWDRYAQGANFPIVSEIFSPDDSFLDQQNLISTIKSSGFIEYHNTKKLLQFRRQEIVLYVKRDTRQRPIVIHPQYINCSHELSAIGTRNAGSPVFYRNSNLREFPNFEGSADFSKIHYGLALNVEIGKFSKFLDILEKGSTIQVGDQDLRVIGSSEDPLTEKERLVAARVGQGDFRTALIAYWAGQCPILDVDDVALLRASHIKPWKDSNNKERLDVFNGFLLSVQVDHLFDRGLLSFDDGGAMLISPKLSKDNAFRLGIPAHAALTKLDQRHLIYLREHRRLHGF